MFSNDSNSWSFRSQFSITTTESGSGTVYQHIMAASCTTPGEISR
jgi:hypothetical protein